MKNNTQLHAFLAGSGLALLLSLSIGMPVSAQNNGSVEQVLSSPQPLSDREKLSYAQETVREIKSAVREVQEDADESRKSRDILKLNCLNEKLTDLKALAKVTETALAQLDGAIAKAQDERSEHEFEKVVIARKRAQDLLLESKACTGEGVLQSVEGLSNLEVISNIDGDAAIDVEAPFDPGLEPPAPLDLEPTPVVGSQSRPL